MSQPEPSRSRAAKSSLVKKVYENPALSRQEVPDLELIKKNISERIVVAETQEEISGLLSLLENVQGRIEKENQTEEDRKSMVLIRRFQTINLVRKILGISASIGIGLYLTLLNSLVGPFVLIIGLAICMDIPTDELSNLIRAFTEFMGGSKKPSSNDGDQGK